MSQQYLRVVSLTLEGAKTRDLSEFRFRFDVRQNDASTPNVANVIVTNLSDTTANEIRGGAKTEYKRVTIAAGYRDGGAKVIFSGDILQVRTGREDATDTYLHILATSGERARNHAVVNKTLAAGHTMNDRVKVATDAMRQYGMQIGFVEQLSPKKFSRGAALFGAAKDLLHDVCKATGSSWSIQNNVFQLIDNARARPGSTVVLNSKTGLLGRATQTIQGIEARCLLNPLLIPGGLVQIDEKSIDRAPFSPVFGQEGEKDNLPSIAADGKYKLYLVDHHGDTRGNDFSTEFIGIRVGDEISIGLADRGILIPGLQSPPRPATTGER